MTEGTKSYLIGCHQFFFHPLWVLFAWRLEYKSWPRLWQIVCIFLHDIGLIGKQYLSDSTAKRDHWLLGARIAKIFFGAKGWLFIAGHTGSEDFRSELFIPDKRSRLVSPMWWVWWEYWIEFRPIGFDRAWPRIWRQLIADNLAGGYAKDSHDIYLENRDFV